MKLRGRVVRGERVGRKLGFPTANVKPPAGAKPPRGVWKVRVRGTTVGERLGACNVGVRPTLGGTRLVVEVHVPGFKGNLYGRTLELEFLRRIRAERRFPSFAALRAQIAKDVASVAKASLVLLCLAAPAAATAVGYPTCRVRARVHSVVEGAVKLKILWAKPEGERGNCSFAPIGRLFSPYAPGPAGLVKGVVIEAGLACGGSMTAVGTTNSFLQWDPVFFVKGAKKTPAPTLQTSGESCSSSD